MKLCEFLKEDNWTIDYLAVDSQDNEVDPRDESAVKFCLLGALTHLNKGYEYYNKVRKLARTIDKECDDSIGEYENVISLYNDGHSFGEVYETVLKADV